MSLYTRRRMIRELLAWIALLPLVGALPRSTPDKVLRYRNTLLLQKDLELLE